MSTELASQLRDLRRSGCIDEARALLAQRLAQAAALTTQQAGQAGQAGQAKQPAPTSPLASAAQQQRLQHLAWQHAPFWWQPLQGRSALLRRRGPQDVALLRAAWQDTDFMQRFNRMAAPLPESDDALRALLTREHWALPEESRALHWTIEAAGQACGCVSVVEISLQHRRAEFLIGVLPTLAPRASPWLALEASHLVFDFLATQARLERLTAYFYTDNLAALRMAEKLGFEREGRLKGYLRLPGEGVRADLLVAGLLLDSTYFDKHRRLRQRLLDPA